MSETNLLERVAILERRVAELETALAQALPAKDWQRTVGMFAGDEVMKRIDAAARKYREADRAKARCRARSKKQAQA